MANTVRNTFNKIGDTIEDVFGSNDTHNSYGHHRVKNRTCLEMIGMNMRNEHLMRNEWTRDLQYTKPLVDSEYLIQTEFKIK